MKLSQPMVNALRHAKRASAWARVADARTLVALEHRGLVVIEGGARDGWYRLTDAGRAALGKVSP